MENVFLLRLFFRLDVVRELVLANQVVERHVLEVLAVSNVDELGGVVRSSSRVLLVEEVDLVVLDKDWLLLRQLMRSMFGRVDLGLHRIRVLVRLRSEHLLHLHLLLELIIQLFLKLDLLLLVYPHLLYLVQELLCVHYLLGHWVLVLSPTWDLVVDLGRVESDQFIKLLKRDLVKLLVVELELELLVIH